MNIHEYQAKSLLAGFGVAVPSGALAERSADIARVVAEVGGPVWVVKAQIHAGGRGKGGGVIVTKSAADAEAAAEKILGMNLVTHQTGPEGKQVNKVYIEQGIDIARELYLSLLIDRTTSRVTLMASTEGGMDIEEVAAKTPEKILTVTVDPVTGLQPYNCRTLAFGMGLEGPQVRAATKLMMGLYKAFIATDASLMEINPLAVTGDGDVIALDAKANFDDNSLFRHKEISDLRDLTEEDASEILAQENELNYIKLDGDIGCLVNGAGLAMATMDIIKFHGGDPANFLDVGGGAPKDRVIQAFKIILSDPNVRGILVNVFAGINRCDVIAEGVVAAAAEIGVKVPLVVRLEGTKVEEGRKILADSPLSIITANGLADAAEKIVSATRGSA